MISGQCDKLRVFAQTYRMLGNYEMEQTLLGAADTIWELRDDLQQAHEAVRDAEHDESMAWDRVRKAEAESASLKGAAQGLGELCDKYKAENAKLRDSLEFANNECEKVSLEYLNLQAENAELRELCRDMWDWTLHGCSACSLIDVNECLTDIYSEYCLMREMLTNRVRELGVEVDE